MSKIGVGWVLRKAGASTTSTTTLSQEGEGIRIKIDSTLKSSNTLYPLGQKVSETTMDGRKVDSTVTLSGGQIVKTEAWDGNLATLKYTLQNDSMIQVLETSGIICKRIHSKV